MSNNNYSWNKTLKFSWGHIIAFLALIFISYVCYMGSFYLNGGDFMMSAIQVLIIVSTLLFTFIGAQICKGTDAKFDRTIIFERILILLCPIVFAWSMISYNHFWTVFSQREEIENQFNTSINKSKQMFVDYDTYANKRIENYSNLLNNAIANKATDPNVYYTLGFAGNSDEIKKENYIKALRLQLLSQNTDSLEHVAYEWIDKASQNATVWNAFLVGNVNQIANAITNWNQTLITYSQPLISNESLYGQDVKSFDSNTAAIDGATAGLKTLTQIYTSTEGVNVNTVITGFILFVMLLFPYILQSRCTKANGLYFLIPISSGKQNVSEPNQQSDSSESEFSKSKSVNNDSDDIFSGTI